MNTLAEFVAQHMPRQGNAEPESKRAKPVCKDNDRGSEGEISEGERVELRSRWAQDQAFQAALRREVMLGHEKVTCKSPEGDLSGTCPAPAASTSASGAQNMRSAADRGGGGRSCP